MDGTAYLPHGSVHFCHSPRLYYFFMDPLICPPGAEAVAEASWRWQREFAGFLSVNTQCAQPSLALQAAQQVAQSFALVCPMSPCAQPERPIIGQVAVGFGSGPGAGAGPGDGRGLSGPKEPVHGPPVMLPLLSLSLNSTLTPDLNSRRQVLSDAV